MATDTSMTKPLFPSRVEQPDRQRSSADSSRTGTVLLVPIDGSVERTPVSVELDLTRADGVLVLGDLRRAAESHHSAGDFEVAHRLWTVVREAADRLDHEALVARSVAMGDGALLEIQAAHRSASRSSQMSGSGGGRRGVTYDYVSLAADRESGMTQRETASKWECSPATVSRAVRYVAVRDELLASSPEIINKIHLGKSVDELAGEYVVETKIMRWVVSSYWDRRG